MADSVNLVFGRNLRKLCEGRGTITDAAKALDIGRIQMTRMLKGESFPKPHQLQRICQYFAVDARILTEALHVLRAPMPLVQGPAAPSLADLSGLGLDPYLAAPNPLPDGVHMLYRPAFTLPGKFVAMPLLVQRKAGKVLVKSHDAPPEGTARVDADSLRDRSFRGIAMTTPDGVVVQIFGTGRYPFLATAHFVSHSYVTATGAFRGTYEIFRPSQPDEARRVPVVLSILRQRTAEVLRAARQSGICSVDAIPERFRPYLVAPLAP